MSKHSYHGATSHSKTVTIQTQNFDLSCPIETNKVEKECYLIGQDNAIYKLLEQETWCNKGINQLSDVHLSDLVRAELLFEVCKVRAGDGVGLQLALGGQDELGVVVQQRGVLLLLGRALLEAGFPVHHLHVRNV